MSETTTTGTAPILTVDVLKSVMEAVKGLGEDPLVVLLRRHGFDPERGGRLLLPESLREMFAPWGPPHFVLLHPVVTQPIMFTDPLAAARSASSAPERRST